MHYGQQFKFGWNRHPLNKSLCLINQSFTATSPSADARKTNAWGTHIENRPQNVASICACTPIFRMYWADFGKIESGSVAEARALASIFLFWNSDHFPRQYLTLYVDTSWNAGKPEKIYKWELAATRTAKHRGQSRRNKNQFQHGEWLNLPQIPDSSSQTSAQTHTLYHISI